MRSAWLIAVAAIALITCVHCSLATAHQNGLLRVEGVKDDMAWLEAVGEGKDVPRGMVGQVGGGKEAEEQRALVVERWLKEENEKDDKKKEKEKEKKEEKDKKDAEKEEEKQAKAKSTEKKTTKKDAIKKDNSKKDKVTKAKKTKKTTGESSNKQATKQVTGAAKVLEKSASVISAQMFVGMNKKSSQVKATETKKNKKDKTKNKKDNKKKQKQKKKNKTKKKKTKKKLTEKQLEKVFDKWEVIEARQEKNDDLAIHELSQKEGMRFEKSLFRGHVVRNL